LRGRSFLYRLPQSLSEPDLALRLNAFEQFYDPPPRLIFG
jgi:hypothetical protein